MPQPQTKLMRTTSIMEPPVDRSDQRHHLSQTGSSTTTPVWMFRQNQARQGHWQFYGWGHSQSQGSLTRDRWTQLTFLVNIMRHTTCTQSNSSVSSAVVIPFFSSMSKFARESFAALASARQKSVHCTPMIAKKLNDENDEEKKRRKLTTILA